jgi:hypothetical protein
MSNEHTLNDTICPLCKADTIAFHGDKPEDQCGGCHVIVCSTCNAGFDLLYSAHAAEMESLDEVKTAIAARWNAYREPAGTVLPVAKGLH